MAALVLFNFLIAALTFWLQAHYMKKHISTGYTVLHPEGIAYKIVISDIQKLLAYRS